MPIPIFSESDLNQAKTLAPLTCIWCLSIKLVLFGDNWSRCFSVRRLRLAHFLLFRKDETIMKETIVCSKKINLFKKIKIAWLVIAIILIAVSVFSAIKYSEYKKAQETAVDFVLAATSKYDKYKNDYNTLVKEMYDDLNPRYRSTTINGYKFNNSSVVDAAREADETLGELMSNAGYDCYYGSKYLEYVGFFDYTINSMLILFIIWVVLALLLGTLNLCYYVDTKKAMIIDTDRIVCKKGKKTAKEFLVKDIKSVELASMKGLMIRGNGFKYKIKLLSNADELKTTIMDSLATLPTENITATEIKQEILPSNADELKKYKELLDSGIITQEEFDSKKKQLLGL